MGLLLRNLSYYCLTNLAVLLGIAVGAAVLTGALLVGDSLRGSLRERALLQIGFVHHAYIGQRLIRESTVEALPTPRAVPVLLLRGTARPEEERGEYLPVAGQLTIIGTDDRFLPDLPSNGLALSHKLADELQVTLDSTVTLQVPKVSDVPRESVLGRTDTQSALERITLPVRAVLPNDHPACQFALSPGTGQARNIYVPLKILQERLDLPGRVNAILTGPGDESALTAALRGQLDLSDYGLVLRTPLSRTDALFERVKRKRVRQLRQDIWPDFLALDVAKRMDTDRNGTLTRDEVLAYYRSLGVVTLESRQLLIEPTLVSPVQQAAKTAGLAIAPTSVYLANRVLVDRQMMPYVVMAAMDVSLPAPLGLNLSKPLAEDEAVLVRWAGLRSGSELRFTYFGPEQKSGSPRLSEPLRIRAMVENSGVAADPDLAPELPGLTDQTSLTDWDPPPPFSRQDINDSVKAIDKDYWRDRRTSPRVFISPALADKLFASRFGTLTGVRVAVPAGQTAEVIAERFSREVLRALRDSPAAPSFSPVRERMLTAAAGSNDFGMLFVGFSFFLIAAALLLVGLLVRLNAERRASEAGLLLALGWRLGALRTLWLAEGLILACIGALLGLAVAAAYAQGMLGLIGLFWNSDVSFLRLHITAASLALGFFSSVLTAGLAIALALRGLGRVAPVALLKGSTPEEAGGSGRCVGHYLAVITGLAGFVTVIAGRGITDPEGQAGAFMGGGMLLLVAGLSLFWWTLRRPGEKLVSGVAALARRNAQRNTARSILTASLLAMAAFLLVAVDAFRRSPQDDFLTRFGGSGGYEIIAETDLPFFQDLDLPEGRQSLLDALEKRYQALADADFAKTQARLKEAKAILDRLEFVCLRRHAGDDASCQNLYQPKHPRLVGVPDKLIERGGFRFAGTARRVDNPWTLLNDPPSDAVPAFGEANSLTWALKTGLGGVVPLSDEPSGLRVRIAGVLKDSVFQGELLVSESQLKRLYPQQEGYSVVLVSANGVKLHEVRQLLQTALAERGFVVREAASVLSGYLDVQNAYLSTFQVLGGLGLLLGVCGLSVVLLRAVWERRAELALLRALGWRLTSLAWLVLLENVLLLAVGLGVGVGAAAIAVAPHIAAGGTVDSVRLTGMLGGALTVGLLVATVAVWASVKAPLIPALRRE